MTSLLLAPSSPPESLFGIGKRLAELLAEAETASAGDGLPLDLQNRIVNALEAIRSRLIPKADRDPQSLFDLDEHLIKLMDGVEESIAEGGDVPEQLQQEINDYLAAFRTKSTGSPVTGGGRNRSRKSARAKPSASSKGERRPWSGLNA